MIKELVIHLGDTKTGSTSIQNALLQGAFRDAGATILYPTSNHHNALVRTLVRKRLFKQRGPRFERLNTAFKESDADLGVISAEHFQGVAPNLLADVLDEHLPGFYSQTRLISYVRPHAEKLLSAFSERVKLGYHTGSFEAFLDKVEQERELIYLPRFTAWRERFGARFTLRPFVRSELFRGDVVADFFRFLLGHDAFTTADTGTANTSLTLPQLALLRDLHSKLRVGLRDRGLERTLPIQDASATLGRAFSEHLRAVDLGADGAPLAIPAALKERIHTLYAEDAAALDAAFFDGTPMSDALEKMERLTAPGTQSLEAVDHFAPGELALARAFGAMLAKMLLEDPKSFQKLAMSARLMFSTEQDA
jgi:hypothetical protein